MYAGRDGKVAIYRQIEGQRNGAEALTVKRMCALAKMSRAGFYRFPPEPARPDSDVAVHARVQAGRAAAARNTGFGRRSGRAFEVNPNVLHRWRREFRQGPGNAFPGLGQRRWEEGRVAQLEHKVCWPGVGI